MTAIFPTIRGLIDRRMLVNFRVRPDVAGKLLPAPFRPKLVRGWAMAGICLIRLKNIRPAGFPAMCGINSENAAHRIAVEWGTGAATREAVFIPRRDTSSSLQSLVGGRMFPGVHHQADFRVQEEKDEFSLHMKSRADQTFVELRARRAAALSASTVFSTIAEASNFFARGSAGYSATSEPDCCDGLELHTFGWQVEPLEILSVKSSFFDDTARFPSGTIEFDCALLMQGIEHEWRTLPRLRNHDEACALRPGE